jgi:hypothetical protein
MQADDGMALGILYAQRLPVWQPQTSHRHPGGLRSGVSAMSTPPSLPSSPSPELLVHALELEHESAERYRLLAETMAVHHNAEVAELFRRMADMSDAHASEVIARAEGLLLPEIAPWDFKWSCPGSPEVTVRTMWRSAI